MASKHKLSLDLNKITSGVDIKSTIQSMDKTDASLEDQELRSYKKVPFKKLKSSPLNDYPIIAVEEMENLLLAYGLLEPLNVCYIEDDDVYEIESGDRRFHALQNLYVKYEEQQQTDSRELYEKNIQPLFTKGVGCMIEKGAQDRDSRRSRIIVHNETSRPFDPIRTSNRLAELAEIYTRQNASLPAGAKINVNEQIAKDLNGKYGTRQIIRYKNFDSLIPTLKEVAVKYNLNIAAISAYHTLTELEQSILVQYIENTAGEKDLPSIDEIRSSLPPESTPAEEETVEAPATIEAPVTVETPAVNPEDALSNLKNQAAKKILGEIEKRETKIRNTLTVLQKKSAQLEKILNGDSENIGDSTDEEIAIFISQLDEIEEKLNAIKTILSNR